MLLQDYMKAEIIKAYQHYVLLNDKAPASVYVFANENGFDEAEFFKYFGSFHAVEEHWMLDFFNELIEKLDADEVFQNYGAREKYTAFLYAWVENALKQRSFLLYLNNKQKNEIQIPAEFKAVKEAFMKWIDDILRGGIDRGEVMFRQIISEQYPKALWMHFIFIHRFWIKDSSPGFEKTDAAIEKSVNLAFDLMSQSAFDSALDFGKFLFQNSRNS